MPEGMKFVPQPEIQQPSTNETETVADWEKALDVVEKLSEVAQNLGRSKSPGSIIGNVSKFIEKNADALAFALNDDALIAELLPSLPSILKAIEAPDTPIEVIKRVEIVLEQGLGSLTEPKFLEEYPEILPSYLKVMDYGYSYLDAQASNEIGTCINRMVEEDDSILPAITTHAPIITQPMLEGDRGTEMQSKVFATLAAMRAQQETTEAGSTVIKQYIEVSTPNIRREIMKHVYANSLQIEGIDTKLLTDTWLEGALGLASEKQIDFTTNLERNLQAMKQVKDEFGEEALLKLHKEYGICHFGRYPIELYKQILEHDPELPTATLIYPYVDQVAVFYEDQETFRTLMSSTQKFNFNLIEAGDGTDAYSRVKNLREEYPDEDVDLVIIGGHGQPDSLSLGNEAMGEGSTITKELLSPSVLRLTNRLVHEETTLIFVSCNVGKKVDEGSLAKHVFDGTKVKKVIAATNPISGLRNFRVLRKKLPNSSLEVDVDFAKSQGLGVVKKQVYLR